MYLIKQRSETCTDRVSLPSLLLICFHFKKCQHANLIQLQERFDRKFREVFLILYSTSSSRTAKQEALVCGSFLALMAGWKMPSVISCHYTKSAGSSKLLAAAAPEGSALCPELAAAAATPMGTVLFSQNRMGLEVNWEVIWSFLQP